MIKTIVLAQADIPAGKSPIQSTSDILRVLGDIAGYLYTAFFIVAIIFIIIAAFNFLTAQGNEEKIKSARAQIYWAIIAIALVLISVAADTIINQLLTS
jgi:phage-related holin